MYDFDKTLSPKDMQEYGFIPSLGYDDSRDFWRKVSEQAKRHQMDQILSYMKMMLDQAKLHGKNLTREWFKKLALGVDLFPGVDEWFELVNAEGARRGLVIEHYIVSSGLKEIIEGTAIARYFKEIYACEFVYENDKAVWPAQAVNYTTKTQYIFRINKGVLDVTESEKLNAFIPHSKRKVPFENMIYIGDGMTDVPCMRLVLEKGGNSIAIYNDKNETSKEIVRQLVNDQRVNYCASSDYSKDKQLHQIVTAIFDQVKAKVELSKYEFME